MNFMTIRKLQVKYKKKSFNQWPFLQREWKENLPLRRSKAKLLFNQCWLNLIVMALSLRSSSLQNQQSGGQLSDKVVTTFRKSDNVSLALKFSVIWASSRVPMNSLCQGTKWHFQLHYTPVFWPKVTIKDLWHIILYDSQM